MEKGGLGIGIEKGGLRWKKGKGWKREGWYRDRARDEGRGSDGKGTLKSIERFI
jgi:hypothetical protein